MATYSFSALSSGQAISFDPSTDVLNFDQTAISAASLQVTYDGTNSIVTVIAGSDAGKSVVLSNTSPLQLATTNVTFANGSALLFGDNSASTAGDGAGNSLSGTGGNDLLAGFGGSDTIFGNSGNDRIEGGAGNDTVSGGSGQDQYVFHEFGAANADVVSNFAAAWDSLYLDASAFAAIGATGRFAPADMRFYAAAGATSGHDADDRIVYNTSTGQLFYDADGSGTGAAQLIATFSSAPTLAASDINVFATSTTPPPPPPGTITGTPGNDSLVGTSGNDTIDGGAGADTMDGGVGDDVYIVDNTGDVIIEAQNGGIDEARASVSYTLGAWVNNLTLTGAGAIDGTGNDVGNAIIGNSAVNALDGGAANDTLTGGAGADSFDFTGAPGAANADLITDFATGVDKIHLDALVMTALGTTGSLATGDARFYAAAGASGGHDADDRVVYDTTSGNLWYDADGNGAGAAQLVATLQGASALAATDVVIDNGSTPPPPPPPSGGETPPPGSIVGTDGNDTLFGTTGNDTIYGLGGNDLLSASNGNDSLAGGTGNDTLSGGSGQDSYVFRYYGATNADVVTSFDTGWDRLQLDAGGFTAIGATGRFASGDARFYAAAGATSGHDADDRIVYNTSTGQLFYDADGSGAGSAQLVASFQAGTTIVAADLNVFGTATPPPSGQAITGTAGNDSLTGGDGNDTIDGLAGNDTLTGQAGADTYVLDQAAGGVNADVIVGFVSGTDRIQLDASVLSALGASGSFSASDARFYYLGGYGYAHDATDRIIYDSSTGSLYYDADGSALGASWSGADAQLIATLEGAPALTASDIVVVNGRPSAGVSLDGGDGNDSLRGTSGDDTLSGGLGNDTLEGLAGNDILDGGFGSDSMAGGDGNDTLYGGIEARYDDDGSVDTMDGGLGNDTYVIGRQIANAPWYDNSDQVVLRDAGGVDTIVARSGYWQLGGGFENLELFNGFGEGGMVGVGNELNNLITAHTDWYVSAQLDGADGDDTLIGGDGRNTFSFAAGSGNYGHDYVDGGGDADGLNFTGARSAVTVDFRSGTATGGGTGGSGSVTFVNIESASGSDFGDLLIASDAVLQDRYGPRGTELFGAGGDDTLRGGLQGDQLDGGSGSDEVHGGAGNDSLTGGTGDDRLFGDDGDDWFSISNLYVGGSPVAMGTDTIDGGAGADQIYYGSAQSGLLVDFVAGTVTGGEIGGAGSLRFTGIENFSATAYGDAIRGDAAANVLNGAGGADTIFGGGGDDTIYTDAGYYGPWTTSELHGEDGNDALHGSFGADLIEGGAGNDSLDGSDGWDTLSGGAGNDTLSGSYGRDAFVFDAAPGGANADLITDFASGQDEIRLDAQVMPALGALGDFATGDARFYAAAGASGGHDADDRVVYDTTSGRLWYDADGSGIASAQLIATLQPGAALVASDITVYDASVPMGRQIDGTAANDTLIGGTGDDTLNGFAGDDYLDGDGGNNLLDGGDGYDRLYSGSGNDTLLGGNGEDSFTLLGGFSTSYGNDVIDGGAGFWNSLAFGNATSGIVADLAAGTLSGGSSNPSDSATLANVEQVAGTRFDDRMTGDAGANYFSGFAGNDTLIGGAGNDILDGGDGNNRLVGGDGNDALYGGSGADTLDGGLGDDSYLVNAGDTIVTDGGGYDRVTAEGSWTLAPELEELYVYSASTAAITGTGNALDNYIYSNSPSAILSGLDGNDSLYGGSGADTLLGGNGNDLLNGYGGNDALTGGAGADSFLFTAYPGSGNAVTITDFASGSDKIRLDANTMSALGAGGDFSVGDSRFYAAAGASGGHDASDRVVYDTASGNLWYDADGSGANAALLIATLQGAPALAASDIAVDNGTSGQVIEGTAGNDSLVGSAGNDSLFGYDGNDTLDGGAGRDTMYGGAGDDLYFVDTSDVIVEQENGGIDEVRASASFVLPAWVNNLTLVGDALYGYGNDVENVIVGNSYGNWLAGYGANDTLNGALGNDSLTGGAGNDLLTGGSGADGFFFDVTPGAADADRLTDFASGVDKIHIGWYAAALGPGGNLGPNDIRFYAAPGANAGHDADDRLVFNATTGQLWYDADGSGSGAAQLVATLQPGAALVATDITIDYGTAPTTGSTINGSAGNDSLNGTVGNDTISGLDGNDTIDGQAGADSMVGGAGDDLYFVDNAGDVVVEQLNGGTDELRSTVSYTLPDWANNLTLLADAANGTGNALENVLGGNAVNNALSGGDGNDTLTGAGGNDVLTGGAGADSFIFDVAPGGANADSMTDFASGVDKIRLDAGIMTALGASGNLSADDPRFYATDGVVNGHDADDRLIYSSAVNALYYDADGSGAGVAQLITTFQSGATLVATDIAVDNGGGTPPPVAGQLISGTTGNDTLVGGSGNDTIYGNSGNDWIEGRGGNDTLSGGSGQDSYVFREYGAANADTLLNFDTAWDMLRLDDAAFTALGAAGRFASGDVRFYAAAGAAGGHDADDRIVYDTSTGQLYYDADGSGAGAAQLVATVQAAPTVVASDLFVI